ncbi:MAG: hypothetical protein COA58_12645 [Bacteroidetes bacterium]|nr:MAG: hypothetical protein COA58_12645 [Bacteroidota bacterium]
MYKLASIVLIIFNLLLTHYCVAQTACGQSQYMDHLKQTQPETYYHFIENYKRLSTEFRLKKKGTITDTIYRIPVFFNILSRNNRTVNFTKLDTMLAVLNRGFNRGDDTSIVREPFADNIANVRIEFYRALLDINGDTIKRLRAKNSFYYYEADDKMKYDDIGLSAYHPEKYLNIWVCNLTKLWGYATPPVYAAHWPESYYKPLHLQGIVLDFTTIVTEYSNNFEERRKTIIHEAGHYLGLRHTWGDGHLVIAGDSSECWRDDGIKDTPYTITPSRKCDDSKNTCIEKEGPDYPDQYENYMDYTNQTCAVMFTNEQKDLMLYNLTNLRSTIYDTAYRYTEIPEEYSPHYQTEIKAYPNPVKEDLHLEFSNIYLNRTVGLEIYSTQGKSVYHEVIVANFRKVISLNSLSAGVYYLEISADNNLIFRRKIVVLGP